MSAVRWIESLFVQQGGRLTKFGWLVVATLLISLTFDAVQALVRFAHWILS